MKVVCPQCKHRFSPYKRQKKSRKVLRRDGHEYVYLEGARDHLKARLEVFARAGGSADVFWGATMAETEVTELEPAWCQGCAETHPVGWEAGEWHHNRKAKGGRRCDCVDCALWLCHKTHVMFTGRMIGGKR